MLPGVCKLFVESKLQTGPDNTLCFAGISQPKLTGYTLLIVVIHFPGKVQLGEPQKISRQIIPKMGHEADCLWDYPGRKVICIMG
jgi:hypothetical protein